MWKTSRQSAPSRRVEAARSAKLAALATFAALSLGLANGCGGSFALDDEDLPRGLAELASRAPGEDFDAFLERAARESEQFRLSLLAPTGFDARQADVIDLGASVFRRQAPRHLEGRRGLGEFPLLVQGMTPEELENQPAHHGLVRQAIAGSRDPIDAHTVYGPFAGKWYGLWDGRPVDHHWSDVVPLDSPRKVRVGPFGPWVWILSWQYAWIGDGYGLNLLAADGPNADARQFLLGYVIHVRDGDIDRETARRPHVGVPVGEGKIIWITAKEMFFEEAFTSEGGGRAYAITGFHYRTQGPRIFDEGSFQAIYSRDSEKRRSFYEFQTFAELKTPQKPPRADNP